ncbi:hypothetical protein N0V82_002545 [Gnomoniopsis sp. IMI 355080]|nr:hypothetical protein N0V82_002545 [Gnomoniopsis sp. IMI 355080]
MAGHEREFWGNGSRRVVEELHTDEDSDTQGAGLITARETRFSSDPLYFTGIDMGENTSRLRRTHAYTHSEEDPSDSEQDTELDEEGYAQLARAEEEALVDSAMRRIRRAQASGKKEVKLSKKELAALEKHRNRQSGGERKKKKEQRYAVPLSQLAPSSQKESKMARLPGAMPSSETLQRQAVQPPVGWFSHPSSSRPGTSDSRRPTSSRTSDREGSTSPFQYNYVRPAAPVPTSRHSSDPASRPHSGSARGNLPYPDARMSQYNPSSSASSVPATLDPFRYMTSGPQAPYHAGSGASLRPVSASPMGTGYYEPSTRGGASAGRRQSRHFTPDDEEPSSEDEDEDETSDEADAGARIGGLTAGPTPDRREEIIVEVEREPTSEPRMTRSKKTTPSAQASPRSSPKPAPKRRNTGGGRRKKGSK